MACLPADRKRYKTNRGIERHQRSKFMTGTESLLIEATCNTLMKPEGEARGDSRKSKKVIRIKLFGFRDHDYGDPTCGRITENVVPSATQLVTSTVPRCASAIHRPIDSPIPAPPDSLDRVLSAR